MKISKRFARHEFACKCGCGFDTVDHALVTALEDCADHFHDEMGAARVIVRVKSGCRCPDHNVREGGSAGSQHLFSRAADFQMEAIMPSGRREEVHPDTVADYLEDKYLDAYGVGRYTGRTHLDTRTGPGARWDNRENT